MTKEAPPTKTKTKTTRRSKSPEKPVAAASTSEQSTNSKLGPSSSEVREDEQAAMEAMMDMDMDQDFTMDDGDAEESQNTVKSTEPVKVKAKQEQGDRKRKRRIVKKSKMEMDDKGYMGEATNPATDTCVGIPLIRIQSRKTTTQKNLILAIRSRTLHWHPASPRPKRQLPRLNPKLLLFPLGQGLRPLLIVTRNRTLAIQKRDRVAV